MAVSKNQIYKIIDRMPAQSIPTIKAFFAYLEKYYLKHRSPVPTLKEISTSIALMKRMSERYSKDCDKPKDDKHDDTPLHKVIDRMTKQSLPTIKSFLFHLENHYLINFYPVPTLEELAIKIALTQKDFKNMYNNYWEYEDDDDIPFVLTWKSVQPL